MLLSLSGRLPEYQCFQILFVSLFYSYFSNLKYLQLAMSQLTMDKRKNVDSDGNEAKKEKIMEEEMEVLSDGFYNKVSCMDSFPLKDTFIFFFSGFHIAPSRSVCSQSSWSSQKVSFIFLQIVLNA